MLTPPDLSGLRRALVIKLRHHGDVLLTAPVLTALRKAVPGIEVDALVYADTADMLSLHPDLAQLHTIDRGWKQAGLLARARAELALFRTLQQRRYDLLVHLTESGRGAWLSRLLAPSLAVAGFTPLKPPGRLWARSFTHLAPRPPLGRRHTVEVHLDALRRIGVQPNVDQTPLTFRPGLAATQRVADLLAARALTAGDFVHLHPTSRWMFKSWTVGRYAELIGTLQARGQRVVLTGAPAANERAMIAEILDHCLVPPDDLSGQLTLKELGALIAAARYSVCVDSVPMHLAAAVGTPVVALFGPSSNDEWSPWRVPHRVVTSTRHPCRPCRLDGCGGGKISDCLRTIEVAVVVDAIDDLVGPTT